MVLQNHIDDRKHTNKFIRFFHREDNRPSRSKEIAHREARRGEEKKEKKKEGKKEKKKKKKKNKKKKCISVTEKEYPDRSPSRCLPPQTYHTCQSGGPDVGLGRPLLLLLLLLLLLPRCQSRKSAWAGGTPP